MSPRRSQIVIVLATLVATLLLAAGAQASTGRDGRPAPGTVSLDQPAYTAHEDQGTLTITIQRTGDLGQSENVGYGVKQQDGQDGIDFVAIPSTYITMAPGQSTYSFQVQIVDQGMNATPVHALAYLYGSSPDTLGANVNSVITILHDDPLQARDPADPLGVPAPLNGNLIAGTTFYVDPDSPAAQAAAQYRQSNPGWSQMLQRIAQAPGAHRFYVWNMGSTIEGQVAHYLEEAQVQQPGATVMLSTYTLVHDFCGYTATPAMEQTYDGMIKQVAEGIGNFKVVFFLELDSLITAPCLDHQQLAIRDAELQYAISALEADPHVLVYLDGGAADAVPAATMAQYLRGAGVASAQGFFLNSTHFDWTTDELRYGQEISALLGGAHFIINTGENGRGPLVPGNRVKDGNEVLCNPPGRGLGPLSVSSASVAQQTGYAGDDGLLWFSNPGGSGGTCVPGAPPTGTYWAAYAVMLARNWVDRVTGPAFSLQQTSPFPSTSAQQPDRRHGHPARIASRPRRRSRPRHRSRPRQRSRRR